VRLHAEIPLVALLRRRHRGIAVPPTLIEIYNIPGRLRCRCCATCRGTLAIFKADRPRHLQ
jgi:hypothetical protein